MILVTVSDDRFGRKGGIYQKTQKKIERFFKSRAEFGIDDYLMLKWSDIVKTEFYKNNKNFLSWMNPNINGLAYKPYAILEGLKKINDNDFLIYNDCSPELWKFNEDYYLDPKIFDINIAKQLCEKNNNILTAMNIMLESKDNWRGGPGYHTHERMTNPICLKKMNCEKYSKYLQHAAGMWIIKKNNDTVNFIKEWLKWNLIPECASVTDLNFLEEKEKNYIVYDGDNKKNFGGNEKYFTDGKKENPLLGGHRCDQSISGLLINKRNNKLVFTRPKGEIKKYNFLTYCRKDLTYLFVNSKDYSNIKIKLKK